MPNLAALAALAGIIGLAIAGFFSSPRPYNIVGESWRQSVACLRARPILFAYAWGLFALQEIMPLLLSYAPWPQAWQLLAILLAIQTAVIYALAHVALRLHRGLILGEWAPGVTWGRRERRMALYVVLVWLAISALRHVLIPAPPTISEAAFQYLAAAIAFLSFLAKAALVLTGPAASLDDPRPLSRAVRSFLREPVAILLIVLAIGFLGDIANDILRLFVRPLSASLMFQFALDLVVVSMMAFVLFLSEFAIVIALTRIWEDHYEPETRRAAHNFTWS